MRTGRRVDLERLATALADYPFAYLITVDDGYRAHTVAVQPQLRGAILDVGLVGGSTRTNLRDRSEVTVLWPPSEPGGYSLIVDGCAEVTGADGSSARCRVTPTRALLHREAAPGSPEAAQGCKHDCVVFSLPASAP